MNVTMSEAMGDYEYLRALRDVLIQVAEEFCADLIVASARFDVCSSDPLGSMRVTPPCCGEVTKQFWGAQKKLVLLLEGVYYWLSITFNFRNLVDSDVAGLHTWSPSNSVNKHKNKDRNKDKSNTCERFLLSRIEPHPNSVFNIRI